MTLAVGDQVTIPIRDGITEGGLIIVGILAAVIALIALVILVLWRFGGVIVKRLSAVQEQVANDHKKEDGSALLLRDDIDEKHVENGQKLDRALALLAAVQRDVAFLLRRSIEQEDRIDEIEKTGGARRPTPKE